MLGLAALAAAVLSLAAQANAANRQWGSCSLRPQEDYMPANSNRVMDCTAAATGGDVKMIAELDGEGEFIDPAIVEHLWFEGNKLSELAKADFAGLHNLKQLFVTDNRIKDVAADAFDHVTGLQYLGMAGNKLRAIPAGSMAQLKQLVYLDISRNLIVRVQVQSLLGLLSLRYLHLGGNDVAEVECGAFNQVQAGLNYVNMSANPVQCGIQTYGTASTITSGEDATITCGCAADLGGGVGYCQARSTPCTYSAPILSLRAKTLAVDQGWERVYGSIQVFVAPTHHRNGQFVEEQAQGRVDDGGGNADATPGDSAEDVSSGILVAVVVVAVLAIGTLMVAVRHRRAQATGQTGIMSSIGSSSQLSSLVGRGGKMHHLGDSQSTLPRLTGADLAESRMPPSPSQLEYDAAGVALTSVDNAQALASMSYLGDACNNNYRGTGGLEEYCHSLATSNSQSSLGSMGTSNAVSSYEDNLESHGESAEIADRPSYQSHSPPAVHAADRRRSAVTGV